MMDLGEQRLSRIQDAAQSADVQLGDCESWPHNARFVIGASEFIAEALAVSPQLLQELLASEELFVGDANEQSLRRRIEQALEDTVDANDLSARLRKIRRREMVRIAWRDLGGAESVDKTLQDLSVLADTIIEQALALLDKFQREIYGVPRDAQGEEQRLVVFALGKLGAEELNFSSDVDLIFAYPKDGETTGGKRSTSNHEYFLRLGRSLIKALQERTEFGSVFRVDMRLRPFGRDGALALNFNAMRGYYQDNGRDWERYALIRMRAIAGDFEQGEQLIHDLTPFIYRPYHDFGALESLREMKAMINSEVERRELQEHIKLGPGGIRELEFTVQAFQLVRGGREPELRERHLTHVLAELGRKRLIPEYAVSELQDAYTFLRKVENHLQEFADQQTHTLPHEEEPEQRATLAHSMGFADWPALSSALSEHRQNVRSQFDQVLGGEVSDHASQAGAQSLLHSEDTAQLHSMLIEFGFDDDATAALEALQSLRNSADFRAMDEAGEQRLQRLLPDLLRAVALIEPFSGLEAPHRSASERDSAIDLRLLTLHRVLGVVAKILRRSTYLALLNERPVAVSHLVKLCAASPWISEQLAQQPQLLNQLLDARELYQPLDRAQLENELAVQMEAVEEDDLEQELAILRQFRSRHILRVASADLTTKIPLMKVSDYLSEIAEVIVNVTLGLAQRDVNARHGVPTKRKDSSVMNDPDPAPSLVVVGYGKLGGLELGYASDLDLIFIHDEWYGDTNGVRPIDTEVYFTRVAQRFVHYMTTATADGRLYEVDLRLRPHGKDGTITCSLSSFVHYHANEGWTWEHQALVRARAIAGEPLLQNAFADERKVVLLRERDAQELRKEVVSMRQRMRSKLGTKGNDSFNIKQDSGGIVDIEFMVQYMVLGWGKALGEDIQYTDNIRLLEGLRKAGLISSEDEQLLAEIYRTYRERYHRLSLQSNSSILDGDAFQSLRNRVDEIWNRIMGDKISPAAH